MSTFTYHFEELPVVKGLNVLASGQADLSYRICPAEPDVGIFEKYVGDIEIEAIRLDLLHSANETAEINHTHWMYKAVEEALLDDADGLAYACEEDANKDRY